MCLLFVFSVHSLFLSYTNSLHAVMAAGPEYKLLNTPTNTTTTNTNNNNNNNNNSCCVLANENSRVHRSNLGGDRRGHKCPPPYFFY